MTPKHTAFDCSQIAHSWAGRTYSNSLAVHPSFSISSPSPLPSSTEYVHTIGNAGYTETDKRPVNSRCICVRIIPFPLWVVEGIGQISGHVTAVAGATPYPTFCTDRFFYR